MFNLGEVTTSGRNSGSQVRETGIGLQPIIVAGSTTPVWTGDRREWHGGVMAERIREYDVVKGPFSGSYGTVSVVKHSTLGTKRAMKRLHSHVKPEIIREEALKQQQVRSPYVVQVYDFFDDPPAILMEYCPFGLDEYLREKFRGPTPRISYEEARTILQNVLQGLNDAHKAGVIHGDIKPANVRFGVGDTEEELGDPKLTDFGAAIRLREEGPIIRGSTNWMAPELIRDGKATTASDYFSFGVLAYLVLTGRHPFYAGDPSCLSSEEENIVSATFRPDPLSSLRTDVPSAVAGLIMELLARDSDARIRAEQDLKAALSLPVGVDQPPPPTPPVPPVSTLPRLTEQEAVQLETEYQNARQWFFVHFRPISAIETLKEVLAEMQWERFRNARITRLADCWSLCAFIHNSGGFFEDAVAAATNGLDIDPDHVSSLHSRGYAYIQLGSYSQAQQDLKEAFDLASVPTKRRQISGLLNTLKARTWGASDSN